MYFDSNVIIKTCYIIETWNVMSTAEGDFEKIIHSPIPKN